MRALWILLTLEMVLGVSGAVALFTGHPMFWIVLWATAAGFWTASMAIAMERYS